jgi:hypothetical protein
VNQMKIFRLNNTYSIVCDSVSNRPGFKHTAVLMRNGKNIDATRVQYYNRTWERYTFQTVLLNMIDKTTWLTDKEKRRFKNKVN